LNLSTVQNNCVKENMLKYFVRHNVDGNSPCQFLTESSTASWGCNSVVHCRFF
jgi:hypothetical protein